MRNLKKIINVDLFINKYTTGIHFIGDLGPELNSVFLWHKTHNSL